MIKSSTRLGVGHFFFETADPVAAVLLCRCSEFVSSRALRAQTCCKKFSKNSEKFSKMLQIPPSAGEPGGGAHLFWGFHYTLFWERSLTWRLVWSRKTSAIFSQNWEKSEHFQPRFWKLSKTSSDHHAAGFLKTDLKFWDQKAKTLF